MVAYFIDGPKRGEMEPIDAPRRMLPVVTTIDGPPKLVGPLKEGDLPPVAGCWQRTVYHLHEPRYATSAVYSVVPPGWRTLV